jgi:hypothetical protein
MQGGAKVFSADNWCSRVSTDISDMYKIIQSDMIKISLPQKSIFETTEEYQSRISPIINNAKKVRTKNQQQLDEYLSNLYDIRFPLSNEEINAEYIADREVWDYISIPFGKVSHCSYFAMLKAHGESYGFEGETYSLPMKAYNPHGVRARPVFEINLKYGKIVLRYFPMPLNVAKRFLELAKLKGLTMSLVGTINRESWYFEPSKIVILKDGAPKFSANLTEAWKVTFY